MTEATGPAGAILPFRIPNEEPGAFLDRAWPILQQILTPSDSATSLYVVDEQGRPIITQAGIFGYNASGVAVVQPDLVQIDTQDLVDGAVQLAQTNIPQLVLGNKTIIGDAVVINLLAGTVEAVTARIDNLQVNDASIVSLTAGKITAGTIGVNQIYVGSTRFEIDGLNERMRVLDGAGQVRVTIGKLGSGSTNYGIELRDSAGSVIFATGSSSSINGAFIASASIGSAAINDLAANKITAGTFTAGVIYAGQINAAQINVGTLTGFLIQTTNGVSQATTRLSGTNNRLESYDASGNLVAAVGAVSAVGGQIYARSPSFIDAAGRFESAGGTAITATTTTIDLGLPTISASGIGTAVFGESSSSGIGVSGKSSGGYGLKGVSSGERGVWGESTSSNGADFKNVAGGGGWLSCGVPAGFGGWAAYAQAGAYGPFTGAHDALVRKDTSGGAGDLVVDVRIVARFGWSDAIAEVAVSTSDAQPGVTGMIVQRGELLERTAAMRGLSDAEFAVLQEVYDRVVMNALGEGLMNVCGAGGAIEVGDLLVTSDLPGVGAKQSDDVVRKATVAKAREAATFDAPDQVKQIACIYVCG